MLNNLTNQIQTLLSQNGEMSAEKISDLLRVPLGNVRVLLFCRPCFGRNQRTRRWGLRDGKPENRCEDAACGTNGVQDDSEGRFWVPVDYGLNLVASGVGLAAAFPGEDLS